MRYTNTTKTTSDFFLNQNSPTYIFDICTLSSSAFRPYSWFQEFFLAGEDGMGVVLEFVFESSSVGCKRGCAGAISA